MVAYKAFKRGLIATHGAGNYQFKEGLNTTEAAHCARCGFHCAEDPLDMFNYYSPYDDVEYRVVVADGDIHEDGNDSKISCTRMIVKQEITIEQVAAAALIYWQKHPMRSRKNYSISGKFKMVRGTNPRLRGEIGEWLCFAIGNSKKITAIGMIHIDGINYMPDVYYDIDGQARSEKDEQDKRPFVQTTTGCA